MVWLEYQKSDGYVVKIHAEEPVAISENNGVIETDQFNVNDEFTYAIYLHLDDNGNPTGEHGAIQQAPVATYLLRELAEKDAKIGELEQVVADLCELLIEQGVI